MVEVLEARQSRACLNFPHPFSCPLILLRLSDIMPYEYGVDVGNGYNIDSKEDILFSLPFTARSWILKTVSSFWK